MRLIRSQVLSPSELRARTRGKSPYCKGNPASTAVPGNPLIGPKKRVVCTGFAVRTGYPHVIPSMSRRGNCFDNAVVESFFSSLKKERIRRWISRSREEARADAFAYIEV